jgi:hypothetical protein
VKNVGLSFSFKHPLANCSQNKRNCCTNPQKFRNTLAKPG